MGKKVAQQYEQMNQPPFYPYSPPIPAGAFPPPPQQQLLQQQQQQQHQQHQQQYQQYQQPAEVPRQFPTAFCMYTESRWSQRHWMLGEHQANPLYAVSLHSGLSGQPDVVLHSGPNEKLPPFAGAKRDGWGGAAKITFPTGLGSQETVEKMEKGGSLTHPTFSFSIEVGPGMWRETFEWRHTSGAAVKALDGQRSGWKLVRLAGGGGAGFGATSSDGKEVVAVWAWASASLTKVFKFQFLSSGANGALGDRWAIMAVITALKIWDRQRREKNARAASGGGA
ncbi:uncharacterized protein F4822DRAFT_429423 [Hypoxylon trugodes]|uniref:uncharacterized protein n=1 Tax=Hypoxylon trugodes TaxID=326681 RepID=UPI0021A17516|nr:uncharacterized protein F4822DRAFT_429423 [Hypoxylon trugodes]KAI1388805.1 hypothetical protein F4822DRAFT_429423 [Hypoxylon trugodes]